jgi:putative ABC transport system permease protein
MRALLVRRRARNDIGQLATNAVMVAVAIAVGIVGPGVVFGTLDEGAREAVTAAGAEADLVVSVGVGAASEDPLLTPDHLLDLAESIESDLPDSLKRIYGDVTVSALSSDTNVRAIGGEKWAGEGDLGLQIALITPENEAGLRLVEGRLPGPYISENWDPVEVVLSRASAELAGIEIGDLLELSLGRFGGAYEGTGVVVVGIVEPIDPSDRLWIDSAELWQPWERPGSNVIRPFTRFTVLAQGDGVLGASEFLDYPFLGTIRLEAVPERMNAGLATEAAADIAYLRSNPQKLGPSTRAPLAVSTQLPEALGDYQRLARAVVAQMSVMMSGVIGAAAIVVVLLSRLLIAQRAKAIALERARGASVVSVALRTLAESVVVTLVGTALGLLITLWMPVRDPLPIVVIAVVAALAAPVQALLLARQLWTGQRDPANRRDRQALAQRRRARRIVIEAAIIVLAVAALVSLRGRGLVQSRVGGIDPLLAVAPMLLAIAITLVVVRLYPYPVRAIGALARRTRGPLGLLGSVRARASGAGLPLLALGLASSLAVSGALLIDTVQQGQVEASWERVGADARITAELSDAQLDALRAAPGVDAVSATRPRTSVGLSLGTSSATITLIAIDEHYADVVEAQDAAPDTESLRSLSEQPMVDDRLAIVVEPSIYEQLITEDISMFYGSERIQLRVTATTEFAPAGYIEGRVAYVDLVALSALMPEGVISTSTLVTGPGTDAAVEGLPGTVLLRSDWLEQRRGLALVAGAETTMLVSVVAVALLAAIALIATVVSGARARGRTLSMLRTLGMSPKLGWWLALAELTPLVIAAVLGGIVTGAIVVLVLAPALGLNVLAGGVAVPTVVLTPTVFVGLAAASIALVLIGALAEVIVHRRDRLSDVLRVGETV